MGISSLNIMNDKDFFNVASNEERLATLEEQHKAVQRELTALDDKLDSMNGKLDAASTDLGSLKAALDKQRGFWAGVTFVASIAAYFLSVAWEYIKR